MDLYVSNNPEDNIYANCLDENIYDEIKEERCFSEYQLNKNVSIFSNLINVSGKMGLYIKIRSIKIRGN